MAKSKSAEVKLPSPHDWRTTDTDEINKRRPRARDEAFTIANLDPRHPVFSNFRVASRSGLNYSVEIRDVRGRQFACDCVDFRINGLGTCKHVEAVLLQVERRFKRLFRAAAQHGSDRVELVPDVAPGTLRLVNANASLPKVVRQWFDAAGALRNGSAEDAVAALERLRQANFPELRISQEVPPWLENRRRAGERKELRRAYELRVQSGESPAHERKVPLFACQREGMLHMADGAAAVPRVRRRPSRAVAAGRNSFGGTVGGTAHSAIVPAAVQGRRAPVPKRGRLGPPPQLPYLLGVNRCDQKSSRCGKKMRDAMVAASEELDSRLACKAP